MTTPTFRSLAEFTLPAMVPGAFVGLVGGVLAAASGLSTPWALAAGIVLGLSLAIAGAVHTALVVTQRIPAGVFLASAVYWLLTFPIGLLLYAVVQEWAVTGSPGLPDDVIGFLTFKAILSTGFAFGFAWVQEQAGMYFWPRIRGHNRYAATMVEMYKRQAVALQRRKKSPRTRSGRAERLAERRARPAAGR